MNKSEYLKELGKRLKYIPKEDKEDAIEYYTELMSDMGIDDTADVTEKLGSPKDAAKNIIDECTQKHVDEYEENKTVKGHATVVWMSILGALSLPVSIPLAIVVLALVFTLIVVCISLIISFAVTAVALVLSGIACLVLMWMAPGVAQKAVVFGCGISSLGLGILLGFGLFYLIRFITRKIFRRNKDNTKENE